MDYQQVIKENAQLLKIGKYKEVLHNITSELQAPYLPWTVEEELRQMYQTALHADLWAHNDQPSSKLSFEQLCGLLRSANPLAQLQACEELKTRNLHHDITIMAHIFASSHYDDEIKSVLLIILCEQKIDYDFLVQKTFQQNIVNPVKLDVNFYAYMFHEWKLYLQKVTKEEDPSVFTLAFAFLKSYYFRLFPFLKQKNNKQKLIYAIIFAVSSSNHLTFKNLTATKLAEMNKNNVYLAEFQKLKLIKQLKTTRS